MPKRPREIPNPAFLPTEYLGVYYKKSLEGRRKISCNTHQLHLWTAKDVKEGRTENGVYEFGITRDATSLAQNDTGIFSH